MKEELRRQNPTINFRKSEDFEKFLQDMSDEDKWIDEDISALRMDYLHPGSTPAYIYEDTTSPQVNTACRTGCLTLAASGKQYLVNMEALFTVKERAGLTCDYTSMLLNQKKFLEFCEVMNLAFPQFSGKRCRILLRAGQILAIHSANYVRLDQLQVFSNLKGCMNVLFPNAQFDRASYMHNLTESSYCLSDYSDKLMEEYAKAWQDAGLDLQTLQETTPVLQVTTSDTGEFCLEIAPLLKVSNAYYPLGSKFKIKHNGTASVSKLDGAVKKCFVRLQEGLATTSQMLQIELQYPVAAMIRAAEQADLIKCAKKACKALVEDYKFCLFPGAAVTAFDLYTQLCDIRYTSEYMNMKPKTRMKINENLHRLLTIDWVSIDAPGPEEVL